MGIRLRPCMISSTPLPPLPSCLWIYSSIHRQYLDQSRSRCFWTAAIVAAAAAFSVFFSPLRQQLVESNRFQLAEAIRERKAVVFVSEKERERNTTVRRSCFLISSRNNEITVNCTYASGTDRSRSMKRSSRSQPAVVRGIAGSGQCRSNPGNLS